MTSRRLGMLAALCLVAWPADARWSSADSACTGRAPDKCHEPPEYVRFAENPGIPRFPDNGVTDSCALGVWGSESRQTLRVDEDPTAPESPPSILRTMFPERFQSGRGPVSWKGWDSAGARDGQKSRMYFSIWIRIDGRDYENQAVGTKMGFFGYGGDPEREARNQGFFLLKGTGRQMIGPRFQLVFVQQGHVARRLRPNRGQHPVVVGQWQHWEAVLALNDMGRNNGVFRLWINGELSAEYNDVVYVTPRAPNGFHGYHWNPTWGGMGGVRTRRDFMLIDHVYMSGLPYTPPERVRHN